MVILISRFSCPLEEGEDPPEAGSSAEGGGLSAEEVSVELPSERQLGAALVYVLLVFVVFVCFVFFKNIYSGMLPKKL